MAKKLNRSDTFSVVIKNQSNNNNAKNNIKSSLQLMKSKSCNRIGPRGEETENGEKNGGGMVEDKFTSDDDDEEDQEEDPTTIEELSVRTNSLIFNSKSTVAVEQRSNSIININNIVNISNNDNVAALSSSPTVTTKHTIRITSPAAKLRSESFPLSEMETLKQQLQDQQQKIDGLKKQNQLLAEECAAVKKLFEGPAIGEQIKPMNPSRDMPSYSVVKVGYLIKRGFTWHNWCSRWCVLRWNTLTYFKSPSDAKPKGLFHVQGSEVAEYHDPKRPYTFTVTSRNRLWYFQATNLYEQRSWMQAIRMAAHQDSFSDIPDTPPKSGKLFRFFGEQPSKDWEERARSPRTSSAQELVVHHGPVPREVIEFISEKETKMLEESGLTLAQVQTHYAIFLSCSYFVTRDRYFKSRISDYNTRFNIQSPPSSPRPLSSSLGHRSSSRESALRRSTSYTSEIGKLMLLQNPRDTYTFYEKIGKGGFADVYVAKNKKTKEYVAVKILSQKFQTKNAKMCQEVSILMTCNHPNIIKNVQNFLYNEEIYMVTEFCEIGSIDRLLKFDLPETAIAFILGQVLHGLYYLHNTNRVHRDIKCSNILLNAKSQIKIADLGLCEELKHGSINGKMSGSKYWLAPEVIARKSYGTPADIWNVGSLGFALATKMPPNGNLHPIKAMFLLAVHGVSVSNLLKGKEWSQNFKDFLGQCFKLDPTVRPNAAGLLQHPFIKSGKRSDLVPLTNACMIAGFMGDH